MTQDEGKRSIIPLFIKAEFVPDDCNVVDICEACERVTGHGSIDGATLVNRLWRILPFNEVSRAKLLVEGVKLFGKHLTFEGKNPFLHASGNGECQTTRLIIKNLPFSYCQSAVARNLIKAGFKLRGNLQWMKGRKRKTGRLSDFRDGRRSVYIDVPSGNVNRTMQMGSFKATLTFPEMALTCYRCLQEGHTAKECKNQEVCHLCKMPGHRRDQCTANQNVSDVDSDSGDDEPSRPPVPPSGRVAADHLPPSSEGAPSSGYRMSTVGCSNNGSFSDVVKGIPAAATHVFAPVDGEYKDASNEVGPNTNKADAKLPIGVSPNDMTKTLGVRDTSEGISIETLEHEVSESPMSEYIKSVVFVELPGTPKQVKSRSGTNPHLSLPKSDVNSLQSQTRFAVPPSKTSDQSEIPACSSGDTLSIWELNSDSEDNLVSMSTNLNESKKSMSLNERDSQIEQHTVPKVSVAADEEVVLSQVSEVPSSSKEPLVEDLASAQSEMTPKKADNDVGTGKEKQANEKPSTDSKGNRSNLSSVIKIKRAFSAILSPPSDKLKGNTEGPQLKKKV